ncbi:MAG: DinB family protein [Blastocatellia bacterium]|jgi:hypothetical protein|nr:DinB family protein [Blastocatellia bacterium]
MSEELDARRIDLGEATAILTRTPLVLSALLGGLPNELARVTEGPGTWSPYDVVGHLIHGEQTDWIPRTRHILSGKTESFEPFDRTAQFATDADKSLAELLEEFATLRKINLVTFEELRLTEADLARTGQHPELGAVTLGHLIATWVVHDLDHVGQISRTLAKKYSSDVGPWIAYLSILRDRT